MEMHIELDDDSSGKVQDILEQLAIRYDLEELEPRELIDALLDIGVDLVLSEDATMPLGRARLIDYCGRKVESR